MEIKQIQYIEKKPHEMDEGLMEKYLDFQEARHAVSKQDEVLRSRDYRRKRAKVTPLEREIFEHFLVLVNDIIVGICYAGYHDSDQETNPDTMWIHLFVLPEYRNQGIGKELMARVHAFGTKHNRPKIDTGFFPSDSEFTPVFATEKLGFKLGFSEQVSRIYKDKINWEYVEGQEKKLMDLDQKYESIRYNSEGDANMILNEEGKAEKYADFFTEADNLIPREDAQWNDVIVTANDLKRQAKKRLENLDIDDSIIFFALDEGNPIALSGSYYPNDPPIRDVGTGFTAVRKAYQGQGIAKFLKLKILRYYVENHPNFEYIFTENAQSNAGMLHINHSLGFKHHTDWQFYQGTLDGIGSYLGLN